LDSQSNSLMESSILRSLAPSLAPTSSIVSLAPSSSLLDPFVDAPRYPAP
jgi:hypothetical protein